MSTVDALASAYGANWGNAIDILSALGGIVDFGYSKAYIHTAGDWLAAHVPAKATLYANDYQLMYYSQHFGKRLFETFPCTAISRDPCAR